MDIVKTERQQWRIPGIKVFAPCDVQVHDNVQYSLIFMYFPNTFCEGFAMLGMIVFKQLGLQLLVPLAPVILAS